MLEFQGKYGKGKILIDTVEGNVISQLYSILNNPAADGSNIVIMPDCHVSSSAMVGFTMTMNDYVVPSIIGVDIGCGINAYNLGKLRTIKAEKLDNFIRSNIPYGPNVHEEALAEIDEFKSLISKLGISESHVFKSLGTLGGGNHFIEVDKDDDNNFWLVIHSGSRNFGLEIANYHINKAKENMKKIYTGAAYHGLEYLTFNEDGTGGAREYINDMYSGAFFASVNRELIAKQIIEKYFKLDFYNLDKIKRIESVHNYISAVDNIVRKGAISATNGEKVIIPFNMAYGCAIATGKSSEKYNFSAPHGAGRIMTREDAKHKVDMDFYKKSMKGIYSTSVNKHTIDEAPQVYKKPKFILESIKDLVDIEFFIKPVYNFKADN